MSFSCHMLKGPPLIELPSLLAGTIRQYSKKAMPQLMRIAVSNPEFLRKEISLYRRWPYQAMVINVLDAASSNMVDNARDIFTILYISGRVL